MTESSLGGGKGREIFGSSAEGSLQIPEEGNLKDGGPSLSFSVSLSGFRVFPLGAKMEVKLSQEEVL
jgi:hypothetical protein